MAVKKGIFGIVALFFVAYIAIWTYYYYTHTPPEDFVQHGAGVVFVASLAGAFGGLLGLALPIAIIAAIGWLIARATRKKAAPPPPDSATKPHD
jgi:hypothetical protein